MSINGTKQDEEHKESFNLAVIFRVFKYMLAYKKQIIAVIFCMILTLFSTVFVPMLIDRAIDVEIRNKNLKGLIITIVVALVLCIIYLIMEKTRTKIMAKVSNNVLMTIRDELYTHIQTLSFSFFDSRPTGKIIARVIGDINSLKDVIQSTVTQLVPDILMVIVVFAVMIIINPMLTLSAIAALPVIFIGMFFAEIIAHKKWQILRKKSSNISAYVHENFSGIGVVQSFTAEKESREEFSQIVDEHRIAFRNAVVIADLFSPTIEISWGIGTFLLYFIGIKVLHMGVDDIGTFTAFTIYLSMFWGPIRNLASYYNKLVTNISAAERVFDIMDTPAEIVDNPKAYELPTIDGKVSFENVSFAYPDEPESFVLHNVNFTINPGETIALVGPTGAGKTTIVNLISRFYNASQGKVLVDGHDVLDVTLNSLRKQMGVMTQDNFLFSGTVKDNIRYGRLDATDDEIIAAAKAVNAHSFIMALPKGYDTEISERGSRLSIGQRQLLAFARTMVSNPRILILDEATSSIDTHTEILVQQGIESLLKNRTSFVIAHRLSTIKNADRIFVIDDGGIVEAGSHFELMEKKGEYYKLYTSQF